MLVFVSGDGGHRTEFPAMEASERWRSADENIVPANFALMDELPEEEEDTHHRSMVEKCDHALRIESLCAHCGQEIGREENMVAALHTSDQILQTSGAAIAAQEVKNRRLERERKLILILDLDQTIIHTSVSERPSDFRFSIGGCDFYVKYRPFLRSFLRKVSKLYEIHIYTMGAREYAEMICGAIDPSRACFGDRIVSRCENFNELTKSIGRISSISNNVVILDDRADVWNFSPNLVLVRPFWYYDRTDINDPKRIEMNRMERRGEMEGAGDAEDGGQAGRRYLADMELAGIYRLLKKIHRTYFRKKKPVEKIIGLDFLKNLGFVCSAAHIPLVKALGGRFSSTRPDFVIENAESARMLKAVNVSIDWIYESVYSRRLLSVSGFIINDFRETSDEYEKELLDEFF